MKSLMQEMVELLKKVESVEVAAERLIERAYDKGYDNGFEHGKESARQFDVDLKKSETNQEKRDRLVKQAKEFVEGIEANYVGFNFKYVINREKRTVVVLAYGKSSGTLHGKGIARCMRDDCFNEHIGKCIALHRLLPREIPQEYLDVPNPTEIRVGDVVSLVNSLGLPYVRSIREFDDDGTVRYVCGGYDHIQQVETGKIIDDSESEPNV